MDKGGNLRKPARFRRGVKGTQTGDYPMGVSNCPKIETSVECTFRARWDRRDATDESFSQTMHPRESSERPRDSGATGGSATGAGVKYQVDFATNFALDLIARLLRETPTAQQNLVIEPREVFEDSITRWDIRVSPDPEVFEAKLKPSKRDLEEWLARVAEGFAQNATAKFCLVYGDLPGAFLRYRSAIACLSGSRRGSRQI